MTSRDSFFSSDPEKKTEILNYFDYYEGQKQFINLLQKPNLFLDCSRSAQQNTYQQIEQLLISMHYLKQTAAKVRDHLFSDKTIQDMQNNFLFQIILLSSIKDFLFKTIAEEEFFLVPENVKKNANKNKKVLVLDMDETLVYTRRQSKPSHGNYKTVHYDSSKMYVESRPLLQEFLTAVSNIFDVYVYTAGNKSYADAVLNQIDKEGVIKRRFYRDCCKKQNGTFYKDLRHLKKMAKTKAEMILIDDNTVSVGHNYPFSIKIKEFEGDQSDKELQVIFKTLLKFYA